MTRTEYLLIADTLKRANPQRHPITEDEFEHLATIDMHECICHALADTLGNRNPSFDKNLFLTNCGVDQS